MAINMEIGGQLLDAFEGIKVDVHHPQVMVNIEVRKYIYIYSQEIKGPGGMPVGTNGKAMLLLSDTFTSDQCKASTFICKMFCDLHHISSHDDR